MDIAAIRAFVESHPEGVVIRMVHGREYRIPHRDYVSFRPADAPPGKANDRRTTFYVWDDEGFRLVNALLVAEVVPARPARRASKRKRAG